MKRTILLLLLIVYACDTNPSITIQLVETTTKSGVCFNHGIKETTIKKTVASIGDANFKIGLKLNPADDYFIATKRISCCLERCGHEDEAILIITELYIVDQGKEVKTFSNTNEFLDFMAAGHYVVINEEDCQDYIEYTFRKII